jgi:hypothetical protein
MEMAPHVEALVADLEAAAAVGDDATAEAARRLAAALRAAAGLRLLDALAEAVLELNGQLAAGRVEIRLAGRDPQLVFVEDQAPPVAADTGDAARITLRLPAGLKADIEAAAAREGASVNTWLVRAVTRGLGSGPKQRGPGRRVTGYGKS